MVSVGSLLAAGHKTTCCVYCARERRRCGVYRNSENGPLLMLHLIFALLLRCIVCSVPGPGLGLSTVNIKQLYDHRHIKTCAQAHLAIYPGQYIGSCKIKI